MEGMKLVKADSNTGRNCLTILVSQNHLSTGVQPSGRRQYFRHVGR